MLAVWQNIFDGDCDISGRGGGGMYPAGEMDYVMSP